MTAIDSIPAPEYQKQGAEVFDFSDETLVDDSIQEIQLLKIFNISQSSGANIADNKYWNFQQNDLMSYYLWSRSMLKLTFLVHKTVGGGALVDNKATTTNDVRCFFRRVRCLIGGQVVYDQPDFNHTLVFQDSAWWTKEYLNTVGSEMMCYPDSNYDQYGVEQTTGSIARYAGARIFPVIVPLDYATSPNCGTGTRSSITTKRDNDNDGTINTAFIPLYELIPCLKYMDKALIGCSFQLELWDSDDNIRVLTPLAQTGGGHGDGEIQWQRNGVELLCRRIIPTSTYKLVLQEQMNKGINMSIKFPQPNIYRFGVSTTNESREQLITTTASRPLHMVALFQPKQFTTGQPPLPAVDIQGYPSDYFDHFNIKTISSYINGIKIPQEGINCEIQENKTYTTLLPPFVEREIEVDANNAYYWFLKHAGFFTGGAHLNNYQDGNASLGFLDWKNRMPIYSFDLSTHEIGDWAGGSSQINIRYTRGTNATVPVLTEYWMYIIIWTESTLGIHQQTYNNYVTLT